MADPLEVVAAGIANVALREAPGLGRIGVRPVLTVVRNTQTGKIYVGFKINVPHRGPVIPAGSSKDKPVTTTAGKTTMPLRGSMTRAAALRAAATVIR